MAAAAEVEEAELRDEHTSFEDRDDFEEDVVHEPNAQTEAEFPLPPESGGGALRLPPPRAAAVLAFQPLVE